MSDLTTSVIGVWVDPIMEYKGGCKKTAQTTVQKAVEHVARSVVKKVNKAYRIVNQPFDPDDMVTNYYPEG